MSKISAADAALNFTWLELSKHVSCSIAICTVVYIAIHSLCKRHFKRSHALCEDEGKTPKSGSESHAKGGKSKKAPAMSSKLATRVISTVNAVVCCVGGVLIMFDVFHQDNSDYFSGCGNGIDIFLCWLGGCVIGYTLLISPPLPLAC
jgi:hypothetical protein